MGVAVEWGLYEQVYINVQQGEDLIDVRSYNIYFEVKRGIILLFQEDGARNELV